MKLTTLLLLIGCLHLSAASNSQTITLDAEKYSLKEVFVAIQDQTDLSVVYNVRFLDRAKPVSISAKNMPLETFLTKVLSDQSLTYNIREKTILIGHSRKQSQSSLKPVIESVYQQRIITGNLTDEDGKPLAGATVSIKGTLAKVASDADGNYRINVESDNATLVFTVVGYQPRSVLLANRRLLMFHLSLQ